MPSGFLGKTLRDFFAIKSVFGGESEGSEKTDSDASIDAFEDSTASRPLKRTSDAITPGHHSTQSKQVNSSSSSSQYTTSTASTQPPLKKHARSPGWFNWGANNEQTPLPVQTSPPTRTPAAEVANEFSFNDTTTSVSSTSSSSSSSSVVTTTSSKPQQAPTRTTRVTVPLSPKKYMYKTAKKSKHMLRVKLNGATIHQTVCMKTARLHYWELRKLQTPEYYESPVKVRRYTQKRLLTRPSSNAHMREQAFLDSKSSPRSYAATVYTPESQLGGPAFSFDRGDPGLMYEDNVLINSGFFDALRPIIPHTLQHPTKHRKKCNLSLLARQGTRLIETICALDEANVFICVSPDINEYCTIIQDPVGLRDILRHVKKGLYSSSYLFCDDLRILFQNALEYYKHGCEEYNAAKELWSLILPKLQAIVDDCGGMNPQLLAQWIRDLDERDIVQCTHFLYPKTQTPDLRAKSVPTAVCRKLARSVKIPEDWPIGWAIFAQNNLSVRVRDAYLEEV